MKKFALCFLTIALLSVTASYAGHIRIKFHGGNLCWLSGSACEGEIDIEWLVANPNPGGEQPPQGYSWVIMRSAKLGTEDRTFEDRTFGPQETEDGSTVYIPRQTCEYSPKYGGFIAYARTTAGK